MRRVPTGFYSIAELSEMTGISTKTLYRLARGNLIPSVRVGRRLLIPIAKWEQFVDEQTNEPAKPRIVRGRPPVFDLGGEPILAQLRVD